MARQSMMIVGGRFFALIDGAFDEGDREGMGEVSERAGEGERRRGGESIDDGDRLAPGVLRG